MIQTMQFSEPQFRTAPDTPVYPKDELGFRVNPPPLPDPVKNKNLGIERSADPEHQTKPEMWEWAIEQLVAKRVPFFADALEAYLGKPRNPRAFASVVVKAHRRGLIRVVAWGRHLDRAGLSSLWLGTGVAPVTGDMFQQPEIRCYIRPSESTGMSAADIENEFTSEDCEGLSKMPTKDAAGAALARLAKNRSYFSAETIRAMLLQCHHNPRDTRFAVACAFRIATKAGRIEAVEVLPSANPSSNKSLVAIYRGSVAAVCDRRPSDLDSARNGNGHAIARPTLQLESTREAIQ